MGASEPEPDPDPKPLPVDGALVVVAPDGVLDGSELGMALGAALGVLLETAEMDAVNKTITKPT